MLADLKFALRQFVKAPGFSAVAVLALALGIATATTMFTFFNGLLVRPIPFLKDESTLLNIRTVEAKDPSKDIPFSMPDLTDVANAATTLAGSVTVWDRTYIIGGGDRPDRVLGTWITADAFQTLGVQPMLGRLFRPEEADTASPSVVILGYEVWQQAFSGRRDIIGQTVTLNQAQVTVIGVMPRGFRFPERSELWQPFPLKENAEEKHRSERFLPFYARMKPGVTVEQVQAELDTLSKRLEAAHPASNTGVTFRALRIREEATRDIKLQMQLMLGSVIAVLLIACGNVANLLLARAATRSREIAVRAALGAGRGRLIRQVMTESMLLGLVGGALGFLLATWELDLVLSFIPVEIPFWIRFDFDWNVFVFALGATVVSSALFGAIPAWQISGTDVVGELKEGGRSGFGSARGRRVRNTLVVLQMALALVLLVVAGLSMRSFLNLQHVETGIDPKNVLTFRTGLPPTMVTEANKGEKAVTFLEQVVQQLKRTKGVEEAAFVSFLPVSEGMNVKPFLIEGMAEPVAAKDYPSALVRSATPGIFDAFRIRLHSGRVFNWHDRADTPRVAVVDESFVRRFCRGGDALGKRITIDPPGAERRWATIVGVVATVRQRPAGPADEAGIWLPLAQAPENFASAVVRVQGDPAKFIRIAGDAVLAVRPDIPIYYAKPMTSVVHETLWHQRFFGGLFVGFAGIAVFLAAIGIYSVTAYSVSQRTQEIGVRMALGAQPAAVIAMVLFEGAQLVVAGLVLGFAAAWAVAHLLAGTLYGVQPHDPPTFAAVPLVLAIVALAACYVPGRRATLIDPIVALRSE